MVSHIQELRIRGVVGSVGDSAYLHTYIHTMAKNFASIDIDIDIDN